MPFFSFPSGRAPTADVTEVLSASVSSEVARNGVTINLPLEVIVAIVAVVVTSMGLYLWALFALFNKVAQQIKTTSANEDSPEQQANSITRSPSSVSFHIPGEDPKKANGTGNDVSSGNGLSRAPTSSSTLLSGAASTPPALPRRHSYRIEEEGRKKSSSEITRRGQLWSRHASWHLPNAPRVIDHAFDQMQGIEQVEAILRKYDVDPHRGFLPTLDPLQRLPYARYHLWEDLADDLPKLLGARLGQARGPLQQLPVLSTDKLVIDAELRRAHLLLCLFAHAYIWGGLEPMDTIPEGIAVPLWEVSKRLDIPPILSHTSIVLYNWRRLDANGDICMENLSTLNNFFDGRDESWFYLITVEIEARGAAAITPMMLSMDAIQRFREEQLSESDLRTRRLTKGRSPSLNASTDWAHRGSDDLYDQVVGVKVSSVGSPLSFDTESRDTTDRYVMMGKSTGEDEMDEIALLDALVGALSPDRVAGYVAGQLRKVAAAIVAMAESLATMREGCHPFIFYHRVRPFLSGWKHNPTLPNGVVYQGVTPERQQFYGGSAAQSSLLPFLDITLGVSHEGSKSNDFLTAMRDYMTLPHRKFLQYMQTVQCVREFVIECLVKNNVELSASLRSSAAAAAAAGVGQGHGHGHGHGPSQGPQVQTPLQQADKLAAAAGSKGADSVWVELRDSYDACIAGLQRFRTGHISLVAEYIMAQQKKEGSLKGGIEGTAGGKGTGGTDLMKFLKPIRDDCTDSLLAKPTAKEAAVGLPEEEDEEAEAEETDKGALNVPYLKDNARFEDIDLYRGGTSISSYSSGTKGYRLPVAGW